jgi:hypothetical protein
VRRQIPNIDWIFAHHPFAHSTRMVNVWFPRQSRHGFEMVHASGTLAHFYPINRKFTPNQINRIFSGFSVI